MCNSWRKSYLTQNKLFCSLSRFPLDKDVDLQSFVETCPQNLTGADFYALCSEAMLSAITRCIQNKNINGEFAVFEL